MPHWVRNCRSICFKNQCVWMEKYLRKHIAFYLWSKILRNSFVLWQGNLPQCNCRNTRMRWASTVLLNCDKLSTKNIWLSTNCRTENTAVAFAWIDLIGKKLSCLCLDYFHPKAQCQLNSSVYNLQFTWYIVGCKMIVRDKTKQNQIEQRLSTWWYSYSEHRHTNMVRDQCSATETTSFALGLHCR